MTQVDSKPFIKEKTSLEMLYAVRGDLNQVAQHIGSGPSLNLQWQTVQVRFLAFHECVHQPRYAVTGVLPIAYMYGYMYQS
jgi:hypothetical protein